MKLDKTLNSLSRGASIVLVLSFIFALFTYFIGSYFIFGILVFWTIILMTVVAWKGDPFGGAFYIIAASVLFLIIMGKGLGAVYFLIPGGMFLTGSLFLLSYVYRGKEMTKGGEDF